MPRMQFTKRYIAKELYMLVRERARAKSSGWPTSTLMRKHVWTRTCQALPTPLRAHMPFRTMSTVCTHGSYTTLLLRQALGYEEV